MELRKSDLFDYLSTKIFPIASEEGSKKIGLEVEMIPFIRGGNFPKRASLKQVKSVLKPYFDLYAWREEKNFLYKKNGALISFEPGGQIEFSSEPFSKLDDLKKEVYKVQDEIKSYLSKENIYLCLRGVDPWNSPDETGLQLEDSRYQNMEKYFTSLKGSLGRSMMLSTASIQVCLDFKTNRETQLKRYILAQFLSPYASAMFANSPFSQKKNTGYESFRSHIWLNLDDSRAGFPFSKSSLENLSREECIQSYLDFALDSRLIIFGKNDPSPKNLGVFTFREWMESAKGERPTFEDFEIALSLLFPEVRPKGFLELRSVDAQDFKWQMVPAVFFSSLLYHDEALEEAFDLTKVSLETLKELKKKSCYGLKDPDLLKGAQALAKLSLKAFEDLSEELGGDSCLEDATRFFEKFTQKGFTPASFFEPCLK
jgi:glutamate--cysteine ligase